MNTSKVTNIENMNRSWESKFGTLHNFKVTMEDGTVVEVNSQKPDSVPYDVGDEVEYVITRENEYGKSGKVKRPEGGPVQPAGRKGFHAGFKAKANDDRGLGMRVGMSINNACQFLIHAEGGAHYDINAIKKMALEINDAAEGLEKHIKERETEGGGE